MKLGLCLYETDEYESQTLLSAAQRLGHEVYPFLLTDVQADIVDGTIYPLATGIPFSELNGILFRGKFNKQNYLHSIDQFKILHHAGIPITESLDSYISTKSKASMYIQLAANKVRIPVTRITSTIEEIRTFADQYGHFVIKPAFGYGGHDIENIEAEKWSTSEELIRTRLRTYGYLICQNYIDHPEGDYRITVVGNRPLFCIRRVPNDKTWKANVAQGADGYYVPVPESLVEISIRATQACGLFVSGVDIVFDRGTPLVFEVNTTPGWPKLQGLGDADVPAEIVQRAVTMFKGSR